MTTLRIDSFLGFTDRCLVELNLQTIVLAGGLFYRYLSVHRQVVQHIELKTQLDQRLGWLALV